MTGFNSYVWIRKPKKERKKRKKVSKKIEKCDSLHCVIKSLHLLAKAIWLSFNIVSFLLFKLLLLARYVSRHSSIKPYSQRCILLLLGGAYSLSAWREIMCHSLTVSYHQIQVFRVVSKWLHPLRHLTSHHIIFYIKGKSSSFKIKDNNKL